MSVEGDRVTGDGPIGATEPSSGWERLSVARGESIAKVKRRFADVPESKIPRTFSKHMASLRGLDVVRSEVRGGLAFLELPDGTVFYGHISKPNHKRVYAYVSDVISDKLTEDTFLLGLDIAQRYATDFSWPPPEICPGPGGVIIECGAYLGHKTIRFANEVLGRDGNILAIEMMPDNADILRRNVEENGLSDVIEVMECGVWSEPGRIGVKGKGRQRNSLLSLENLDEDLDIEVPVDSLDNIIGKWGHPNVDLIFVTVNGAEVEALQGINRCINSIGGIFVAAPYRRDGRNAGDMCAEVATGKGFTLLDGSSTTRLFLKGPGSTHG